MNRRDKIDELEGLIAEYRVISDELSYMDEAWNGDDECERACSDPGLQYEKGEELDSKFAEIQKLCQEIAEWKE